MLVFSLVFDSVFISKFEDRVAASVVFLILYELLDTYVLVCVDLDVLLTRDHVADFHR